MQLERILQSQGFGSRKACRSMIRARRVAVASQVCDDPFADLAPEGLVLLVDDQAWCYRARAYLMLNKPAGYECSRSPKHHPSVLSLLPPPLVARGVQPVGRLDEDTSGLLLMTDDGHLIHRLTSPRHQVGKVYEVTTKHAVSDEQIAALQAGVQLHDEPAPIAAAACALAAPALAQDAPAPRERRIAIEHHEILAQAADARAAAGAWRQWGDDLRASMGTMFGDHFSAARAVKGAPYSADVSTVTRDGPKAYSNQHVEGNP